VFSTGGNTTVTQQAKAEIIKHYRKQYRRAVKSEKSRIIDIITESTGYSRKHIIHTLNEDVDVPRQITRDRVSRYEPIIEPLEKIWAVSNFLCGKRLEPFIPELLSSLRRHQEIALTEQEESLLLSVRSATIDRLLGPARKGLVPKGRSTTKPGTLLKHKIAIRTFADWNEHEPGFLEIDLVAHCGDNTRGEYINTLDMTDVATGWTVCAAFMGRSERFCVEAIEDIKPSFPFAILGIDSDNGSEFINAHLKRYCERNSITFTRGRANKKNDSCYVEQKNWDVVRKMLGYGRFDTYDQLDIIKRIHNLLVLYQNYFQPSQKLLSKERIGARVKKKYDVAQTPCQRLLSRPEIPKQTRDVLRKTFHGLNAVHLLRSIQRLISELYHP
jgi:hypothetical protein